jgi:hypothetical protein
MLHLATPQLVNVDRIVEIIPLRVAVLCENCQCITRASNSHCRSCGSHSVLPLASLIDRKAA